MLRPMTPFLLALAVACNGSEEPEAPLEATFDSIHQRVLLDNCATSGCHSTADAISNLALQDIDEAFDALLNQPCTNQTAIIEGLERVASGDPERSFLFWKLTDAAGMGAEMPPTYSLTDEEIEVVRQWILDGASR